MLPVLRYRVRLDRPPSLTTITTLPGIAAAQTLGDHAFRVTLRPGETPAALAERLVEAGYGLVELTPDRADLEQVFFDILGGEHAA
jgi:hypothetical protein